MSEVKNLMVKLIDSKSANEIVKKYHYSRKVAQNSQLHFGIFKNDILVGALQYGPSIDKRRMGTSLGIGMNECLELNRMAISDVCGKNTESRVLGITLRMIKKKYPFIKCVVSFSDACQCGDGTIYRASNFKLIGYKKNTSLLAVPEEAKEKLLAYIPFVGDVIAKKSLDHIRLQDGKYLTSKAKGFGLYPIVGYQMKYVYFFDKKLEDRTKVIAFDNIPNDVRMYKGVKYAAEA